MSNLSDEELVVLFARGDNEAFNVLLGRYKVKLFSYIYTIVQNKDLTEDLSQDTLVKVISTIKSGRYIDSNKFMAFLFKVAHNNVIDHYRRNNLIKINEADVDYDLFGNKEICDAYGDFDTSKEDDMCHSQVLMDVSRMVKFLPTDQRDVVIMRYYREMSFKEIADKLNISINTALGRMRYAILNMRKMAETHRIQLYA